MLKVRNLVVKLADAQKEVLKGVDLEIQPGEIHLINGLNGSGKSTLVNALMGNPAFEIASGDVKILSENYRDHIISKLDDEVYKKNDDGTYNIDLSNSEPNERSLAGLFLANQYPTEIPGVRLLSYLRIIYNVRRPQSDQLSVFKFKTFVEERAEIIKYPKHLLRRNLNEGFSGGEKKKTELLQMLVLEPRYVMLDEIDSGLDRTSVKEVFSGLAAYHAQFPETSFVIITHYDRAQEFLTPTTLHEMVEGRLI